VVMTCAKNNDGKLGPRSAWERRNGLFTPVMSFDWERFDNQGTQASPPPVTEEHVRAIFANGPLSRADAAARLMEVAEVGRTTAYQALKEGSPFSKLFTVRAGLLCLAEPPEEAEPDTPSAGAELPWGGSGHKRLILPSSFLFFLLMPFQPFSFSIP